MSGNAMKKKSRAEKAPPPIATEYGVRSVDYPYLNSPTCVCVTNKGLVVPACQSGISCVLIAALVWSDIGSEHPATCHEVILRHTRLFRSSAALRMRWQQVEVVSESVSQAEQGRRKQAPFNLDGIMLGSAWVLCSRFGSSPRVIVATPKKKALCRRRRPGWLHFFPKERCCVAPATMEFSALLEASKQQQQGEEGARQTKEGVFFSFFSFPFPKWNKKKKVCILRISGFLLQSLADAKLPRARLIGLNMDKACFQRQAKGKKQVQGRNKMLPIPKTRGLCALPRVARVTRPEPNPALASEGRCPFLHRAMCVL
ncbi:hypothetical protein A9K55_004576 [Cordyceps militaris]|uniref:Uncharacterized protein n=1 Tax=Cordyceps militaris TaxID=73501 RepID=A0A2H4SPM8_CORMI|nr:hypothetical protein A9K55_004576 [Cordyceps militaris]